MSDIARFTIWGCVYTPASSGEWVRYDDHRAEVERLTAELHQTRADGIELRWVADEVEQLTAQRDAAQVEVERLKNVIDYLTRERDEARGEVDRRTHERDEARDERDAVQRERERLQDLLTCERQELSTLRERLFQLRSDQPAQKLDMVSGQAILDSSRPTDEDIWREVFFRCVSEYITGEKRVIIADTMLAEYRKRWPR